MPQSIINSIQRWAKQGMYWPFVFDPQRKEPSVTLMFYYIAFVVANLSICASSLMLLLQGDYINATIMPTLQLILGFIFYRLRNLDRVKIDLDDKQIELSDNSADEKEKDCEDESREHSKKNRRND